MGDVFISYRRQDTRADAGRLYDRLSARFGDEHVFMDIDDIEAGQDFTRVLDDTLDACAAMIVLIGPAWSSGDTPRLDDPGDFVRLEIETALSRQILVIPVLVGDASMPAAETLPDSIRELSRRQAFEIGDARFHDDVDRLVRTLESTLDLESPRRRPPFPGIAIGVAAAAVIAGFLLYGPVRDYFGTGVTLRSDRSTVSTAEVRIMLADRGFFDANLNATGEGPIADPERRTLEGGEVLVDSGTVLMWQKTGSYRVLPREGAEAYVDELNAAAFAGFRDWRLPTLEETMSLMQPDVDAGVHISPRFERLAAPFVWTSDVDPDGNPWIVYFVEGWCEPEPASYNAYARRIDLRFFGCVAEISTATPRKPIEFFETIGSSARRVRWTELPAPLDIAGAPPSDPRDRKTNRTTPPLPILPWTGSVTEHAAIGWHVACDRTPGNDREWAKTRARIEETTT